MCLRVCVWKCAWRKLQRGKEKDLLVQHLTEVCTVLCMEKGLTRTRGPHSDRGDEEDLECLVFHTHTPALL